MRKPLVLSVLCFAFALTACSTTTSPSQHARKTPKQGETIISFATLKHTPKIGTPVAFIPEESYLKRPYRIIGKETVSRYNFIGLKRQTKTVDQIMKNMAASMGGDAVINISADNQKVEGTVISFEKVLL
jgi:hypothetical protein